MATIHVWQKYDAITKYSEPAWGSPSNGYNGTSSAPSGYTSYTFDAIKGYVAGSTTGTASTTGSSVYVISADGKSITRYSTTSTGWVATGGSSGYVTYTGSTYTKGVEESRSYGGTNYGTVESSKRAAYPDNGEQDGYWYIYITSYTVPDFKVYLNIDGKAKEASAIYVNVNGVAKKANNLYCNIGGTGKNYII